MCVADDNPVLVAYFQRIASLERHSVCRQLAADDVQIGDSTVRQSMLQLIIVIDDRGEYRDILMHEYRAFATIIGGDQAQASTLGFGAEMLLLVARCNALLDRHDPDLQEVYGFIGE